MDERLRDEGCWGVELVCIYIVLKVAHELDKGRHSDVWLEASCIAVGIFKRLVGDNIRHTF